MITFRQKGDFSKLTRFLEKAKETVGRGDLDRYGREGVAALASATPIDSGLTASSWYYEIENRNGSVTISFHNSNIQNGVPIAIIIQYGHGTRKSTGSGCRQTDSRGSGSLSYIPLSAHVGAAGSDGSQRGIHGDHGTLFSEKR